MKKTIISAAIGLTLFGAASPAYSNEQPNVVIFYVDDLGYGDLGSYGHQIVKTPNIDRLAKEGIKYTQMYAPAPLCSPSRAGLLTGRTPYRTGIRSWIPDGQNVHIGKNEITLAHKFKEVGYDTAIMGKLHLNGGANMKTHPQAKDLGFDYSFVLPGGYIGNKKVEQSKERPRVGKMYPDGFWRNGKPIGATNKFSGELVSDEVINWLDKKSNDKPFFTYVAFTEVHTPIAAPKKYLDMYSNYITEYAKQNPDIYHWDWKDLPYRGQGEYYANISYVDAQIGKIVDKIKSMGEEDNTLIIFSSDNGPVTREARKPWELNMAGETGGLRGRKDNLFEGGIRVPGIIKFPPVIKSGQVSDVPVTQLDVMPTLAELVNFKVPTDRELDGQSIVATFDGKTIQRKKPIIATIDMPGQDDEINEWAIRDGDWKLILGRDEQPKYLFNLKEDNYEVYNMIDKKPEVLKEIMSKFTELKNSIDKDINSTEVNNQA